MKKRLTHNLGLKFLALFFAFILWLIVVNINDPIDSIVFTGIPIELTNEEAITGEGKVYEVIDNISTVSVTVSAKRSVLENISKDNIKATVDLSQVSVTNLVDIHLSTNKSSSQIRSISANTQYLKLNIEDVKYKQMVIDTYATGTPAEGYLVGSVVATQNVVRLSGPESVINQIASVQAPVSVNGMTQNISTSVDLVFYDADGKLIRNNSIETNIQDVEVQVNILRTQTVGINYSTTGSPAEGYAMTGEIIGTPATVLIAGEESLLNSITELSIPGDALNVTGQTGNLTVLINVANYLPEGIILADPNFSGMVAAEVVIEPVDNIYLNLPEEAVSITHIPEGYEIVVLEDASSSRLGISGITSVVERTSERDFRYELNLSTYIDREGRTDNPEGTYTIEIPFSMPSGITQTQPYYIVLTVKAIETEAETQEI